ncbi:hypothetical protein [Streptomyces sp. NPDC002205]
MLSMLHHVAAAMSVEGWLDLRFCDDAMSNDDVAFWILTLE